MRYYWLKAKNSGEGQKLHESYEAVGKIVLVSGDKVKRKKIMKSLTIYSAESEFDEKFEMRELQKAIDRVEEKKRVDGTRLNQQ
jgi:hypothetical protein